MPNGVNAARPTGAGGRGASPVSAGGGARRIAGRGAVGTVGVAVGASGLTASGWSVLGVRRIAGRGACGLTMTGDVPGAGAVVALAGGAAGVSVGAGRRTMLTGGAVSGASTGATVLVVISAGSGASGAAAKALPGGQE